MHLIALLAAAAAAAPAPAPKDPPASPADNNYATAKGTAGVSFFLPQGSDPTMVGLTYFLANDFAARVDFGLVAPLSPSGSAPVLFSIEAGLRMYQVKHDHVAVYLGPAAGIGRELSPAVQADGALFLRLGGDIGVEYFFTPHFSVAGTLELTLKFANIAGPGGTSVFTTLSTDTSTLGANIYF